MMDANCLHGGKIVRVIALTSAQTQLPALFKEVFQHLQAAKIVDRDLTAPLLEQEDALPTGVVTKPLGKRIPNLALPHLADSAVKEPVLVMIEPSQPLFFANMLSPAKQVEAKLILLLLDSSPARQAETLSHLLAWLAKTPGPQLREVLQKPDAAETAELAQQL